MEHTWAASDGFVAAPFFEDYGEIAWRLSDDR